MFKEDRRIWIYLVGILLLFAILILFGRDVILPIFQGRRTSNISINITKPQFSISLQRNYKAKLETNIGEIIIDLYENNAPQNTNNFIYLANNNYYDGTLFYRVFPDFLAQGGDRNTLGNDKTLFGKGRPNYFIEDEINWDNLDLSQSDRDRLTSLGYKSNSQINSIKFKEYSVAMANGGPGTNSSQFFIVIAKSDDTRIKSLNGYFTNIGEVIEGYDVIETLRTLEVDTSSSNIPTPLTNIVLNDVTIFFD